MSYKGVCSFPRIFKEPFTQATKTTKSQNFENSRTRFYFVPVRSVQTPRMLMSAVRREI